MIERTAELFLAIRNGDTVRCRTCGYTVDFGQSCELRREPITGLLTITKCHACLTLPMQQQAASAS